MNIQPLLDRWQLLSRSPAPSLSLCAELELHDVARLRALAEMHPGCRPEQLMADLLHAALQDVEAGLPYVHGSQVIGEDEFGDPVYEDVGPTPRFLALTRQHLQALQQPETAAGSKWSPSVHHSAGGM